MPGTPMLPSFPLMPCETDGTEMRIEEELLTFTVLYQTAHLGAEDPLFPLWTWRSWQTLRGRTTARLDTEPRETNVWDYLSLSDTVKPFQFELT